MDTETKTNEEVIEKFDDEKCLYEAGFHLLPTLSDDAAVASFTHIRGLIEKAGGICVGEAPPVKTELAYTIFKKENNKNTKYDNSHFAWVKFEADGNTAQSLQKEFETDGEILRSIVVKTVRESVFHKGKSIRHGKSTRQLHNKDDKKDEKSTTLSETELDKTIEEMVTV